MIMRFYDYLEGGLEAVEELWLFLSENIYEKY